MSGKGNGGDEDLPVATGEPGPGEEGAKGGSSESGLAASTPGDDVEALRRENAELRDALLRRRADFENYRRRVERDRGTAEAEAEAQVLRPILATLDNLERALAAGGPDSLLREGVELTRRDLATLLESLGVREIDPLGQRFDPTLHQAILHEPVAGAEPGAVAEVLRKGFTYKGRLLRPALVKVASEGEADAPGGGGELQ